MGKADLVVAYDIFANQTIREAADIVLPGTIWLEEIGAKSTNTHIHLTDRVLSAAGEARPAFELYKGLAERLGVADVYPWADQEAAMNAALDHPATGHATVATLRANGGRVALNVSHVAYPTLTFSTPSGKIEFYSERAAQMGLPALPSADVADAAPMGCGWRMGAPSPISIPSTIMRAPCRRSRIARPSLISGSHQRMRRTAGSDGEPIEVSNARGAFAARAKVTSRMPAGTVWIRDGWPGLNVLSDGASVLPHAALSAFPFSVGQADFGACVDIRSRKIGRLS